MSNLKDRGGHDKAVNSLATNLKNACKTGAEKWDKFYDAQFIDYCIARLNALTGQSKRFIMCKLLESALRVHDEYSGYYEQLKKEYYVEGVGRGTPADSM
jgi:hypothetical protein